jgi:hypothetical protein
MLDCLNISETITFNLKFRYRITQLAHFANAFLTQRTITYGKYILLIHSYYINTGPVIYQSFGLNGVARVVELLEIANLRISKKKDDYLACAFQRSVYVYELKKKSPS